MRCFVSIEFPEHIRSEIFHLFDKLKNSSSCSGNFVEKESLHLTLTFLGEIDEERLETAKKALSKIDFRRFPVETGNIGFFPNKEFVKVLWVDILSDKISSLREEIENVLKKEGFDFKNLDFVPHLTVARIKNIRNKKLFHQILDDFRLPKMLFIAEDFAIMKSVLKKSGPEYKIVEKYGMRIRE